MQRWFDTLAVLCYRSSQHLYLHMELFHALHGMQPTKLNLVRTEKMVSAFMTQAMLHGAFTADNQVTESERKPQVKFNDCLYSKETSQR